MFVEVLTYFGYNTKILDVTHHTLLCETLLKPNNGFDSLLQKNLSQNLLKLQKFPSKNLMQTGINDQITLKHIN